MCNSIFNSPITFFLLIKFTTVTAIFCILEVEKTSSLYLIIWLTYTGVKVHKCYHGKKKLIQYLFLTKSQDTSLISTYSINMFEDINEMKYFVQLWSFTLALFVFVRLSLLIWKTTSYPLYCLSGKLLSEFDNKTAKKKKKNTPQQNTK